MTGRRVLIHTIPPYEGGVPAKTRLLCDFLRSRGWDVHVAWYASLGHEPDLVAPIWRPFTRIGLTQRSCWTDYPGWVVGCRWPESEIAYYGLSRPWRDLMVGFDRHIAVGGNVLVAHRLVRAGQPHLLWCATPLEDDRVDRRRTLPYLRRIMDCALLTPVLQHMERRVLCHTPVLMPVASYGRRRFREMGRREDPVPVLPVPVDTNLFHPASLPAATGCVGFAGRLTDPRKNLTLLLDALVSAKSQGVSLRARLAGPASEATHALIRARGLEAEVELLGNVAVEDLPDFYRSLDVFVIPSHQEGLGIVGVEAIASGLPVISTHCGGPEEYVVEDSTGLFTSFDAQSMATAILRVVQDRTLRQRMAHAGRTLAVERFGLDRWRDDFTTAWKAVWGDQP